MRRLYLAYATIVLAAYSAVAFTGREFNASTHGVVPASVRQSGYRSYSFWRGGK
jgi:hypothetical protein